MQAFALLKHGYKWGGKTLRSGGLDCSGLVSFVYRQATGRRIGVSTGLLAKEGRPVSKQELHEGDLVFFNTLHRAHSHVGIYVGNGQFVHALNERAGVRIDRLSTPYFAKRFDGARTLLS